MQIIYHGSYCKVEEPKSKNDLFFVCSLIEYIARKTKNKKSYIVEKLGKENIKRIYDLAEVYHSENIEKVSDELIQKYKIENGDYDIVSSCKSNVPSFWELGRVYERLIIMINKNEEEYMDTLLQVLSSWIIEKIDNYNSSMYYENPSYIYECFMQKRII